MTNEVTLRGGLRAASLLFLVLCLVVSAVLVGMPGRAEAHEAAGYKFLGVWVAVHINLTVTPAGSGTISVSPSPTQHPVGGQDIWATQTVITATPAEGWVVGGWSLPLLRTFLEPSGWVSDDDNSHCHVIFDGYNEQRMLDDENGCIDIGVTFVPINVQIEVKTAVGFKFNTGVGVTNVPLNSSRALDVEILPAYSGSYEFGGWTGNIPLDAYQDYMDMTTYLDVDWFNFPATTGWWCRPSLKAIAGHSDVTVCTDNESDPNGTVTYNDEGWAEDWTWEHGVGEVFTASWSDNSEECAFLKWDLTNMGCSDVLDAEEATFWPLAVGDSEARALVLADDDSYYDITIESVTGGTTSPEAGTWSYQYGMNMPLKAYAAAGYTFSHWVGVNGSAYHDLRVTSHLVVGDTTITPVFVGGPGGDEDPGDGGPVASGLWGGFTNLLDGVGMANNMGRMMIVVVGMLGFFVAFRKSKALSIGGALLILGVGIIGGWVPIWIVVLLAVGVGFTLLQFARSKGATD